MCAYCGSPLPERVGFRDLCASCGHEMHVCLQCAFYRPESHWECKETVPERVNDKERANFCEWFRPDPSARAGKRGADPKAGKAKDDFLGLFGS